MMCDWHFESLEFELLFYFLVLCLFLSLSLNILIFTHTIQLHIVMSRCVLSSNLKFYVDDAIYKIIHKN